VETRDRKCSDECNPENHAGENMREEDGSDETAKTFGRPEFKRLAA
jgi:hypothetical protein